MLLLACAIIEIILKMITAMVKQFYNLALWTAKKDTLDTANVKIISKKNVIININYNIYS